MWRMKVGGFLLNNSVLKQNKNEIKSNIVLKCYSLHLGGKYFQMHILSA